MASCLPSLKIPGSQKYLLPAPIIPNNLTSFLNCPNSFLDIFRYIYIESLIIFNFIFQSQLLQFSVYTFNMTCSLQTTFKIFHEFHACTWYLHHSSPSFYVQFLHDTNSSQFYIFISYCCIHIPKRIFDIVIPFSAAHICMCQGLAAQY